MAFARLGWGIFVFNALPEPVSSYIETARLCSESVLNAMASEDRRKRREVARRSDSGQRP